ncbi:hypothetical protein HD806DRAFT_260931 [Xylariaceae sp. AK1471]|nr:hypothetical protein HD806DRAFT_260931 [Xylariaceae sp. AK1471]
MSSLNLPEKTVARLNDGFHVQVLFINQISGAKEPKATISSLKLTEHRVAVDVTLKHLRDNLGKKVDSKWAFCFGNCAPVEDSNGLLYYLTLDEVNVKNLQIPPPQEKDKAVVEAASLPVLTVYMSVGNAMAPIPKGFGAEWAGKNPADLTLSDRSQSALTAPDLKDVKAEYLKEAAWATKSTAPGGPGMLDCVVDFSDSDWDKIMMLNKVLYAFDIRGKILEITNARLPAFELKTPTEGELGIPGAHLRPFVEIHDTPNIDLTEVSSEFQKSLVDNAFSSKSLQAMASGGSPMFSASVTAGVKSESSRGTGSSEGGGKKEYYATYNFPRVRLYLDENTLTVSKYCEDALVSLQAQPTVENLRIFQRRFGVIFAQESILGGRLESTKAAKAIGSAQNQSDKDAFKASLGAAVSYGPVTASANTTSETQSSHATTSGVKEASSAISYTARGGDTLLCADPAAWAATVAVWRNWRVIQQNEPVTLQELLGRFDKFKFVPELFASILTKAPPPPVVTPPPVPDKVFNPNVPWTEATKIRLWIGQQQVPSWTLAIRDGDPASEAAPPRKTLLGDYPLLLFKDDTYKTPGRDANTVYVTKADGVLRQQTNNNGPFRFSFRKEGATGIWMPLSNAQISNGDKVTLWCHSVGQGGWKSLHEPPSTAYQAVFNKGKGDLRINTSDTTFSSIIGYDPAIFAIEFV